MCENCGCGRVESFKIIPQQEIPGSFLGKPGGIQDLLDEIAQTCSSGAASQEIAPDTCGSLDGTYGDGRRPPLQPASPSPVGGLCEAAREQTAGSLSQPHKGIPVHLPILAKNDRLAQANRAFFKAHGILAINFVSSPGSGKTTFLAKTLEMLGPGLPAAVIVGDLETANDAARLRGKGAPVAQITTGTVCHLDAEMVARGLASLDLSNRRLLFIENVGNLVCPASFDLGEAFRVVLLSVTEGEDKPLKYPPIFRGAKVVILSKMDLLDATGFDLAQARSNIEAVSPGTKILEVSGRTGEGMGEWLGLLSAPSGV